MTELTERLKTIADEIGENESVCDVGTDHGYLPLYLYAKNPDRKIVMSDVSKGSLAKCRDNCEIVYPGVDFDLRLGSGIEVLEPGEVDCIVMAGMGGILMTELIGAEKTTDGHSFKKYILQPRRHVGRLRYWLEKNGFYIVSEKLVRESRFIWPILTVVSEKPTMSEEEKAIELNRFLSEDSIEYEYPMSLLQYKNCLTREYILNALLIEKQILVRKLEGTKKDARVIVKQTHRVEYMEELLKRIDN